MALPLYQVDAFAGRPFGGNPAGVCFLEHPRSERWMQLVAREMNLSETAFLTPREDGFDLRWFTPAVEVDLCGHATLASAHILWESGRLARNAPARFHTRSGLLTARNLGVEIELDFPATPVRPIEAPEGLEGALGVNPLFTGQSAFDLLVEIDSEVILRALSPDLPVLKKLTERGVIVTCSGAGSRYDFLSRFFAPAAGIDEDPVTGSAHCALGPFWGERLGKTDLRAYQASARGGAVGVRLQGERVLISGQAVTVFSAELND